MTIPSYVCDTSKLDVIQTDWQDYSAPDRYQYRVYNAPYRYCLKFSLKNGIVRFNIPLDTLYIISWTILEARWLGQRCHSTTTAS